MSAALEELKLKAVELPPAERAELQRFLATPESWPAVLKHGRRNASEKLAQLLEGVTPENLHEEWDTGAPVGKEVW